MVDPDTKPRVPILTGPTGVGKSELAVELALACNGVIISADSRQIYRGMDIGTAKPDQRMRNEVPHFMLDILDPDASWSAGGFADDALNVIQKSCDDNLNCLVVGGAGFYIEALIHPLYSGKTVSHELREKTRKQHENLGDAELHAVLTQIDPVSANTISVNDRKKVLRYIEIAHAEGDTPSTLFHQQSSESPLDYQIYVLHAPRDEIYRRINQRVEKMVSDGLLAEVAALLDAGYEPHKNGMDSVGYNEITRHLQGNLSLAEAVSEIQKNTRRYAKRQLTWFKRWENAIWVDRHEQERLLQEIPAWLENRGEC